MKKVVAFLTIILSMIMLVSCGEDRSYTIDKVSIFAYITESGTINVRERYTYSFDGSFDGLTRDIQSSTSDFNAYLLPSHDLESIDDADDVQQLSTELENHEYKIYTKSQDETKTVLYTYEIHGSIEKYKDIGKLHYSFFNKDNQTDINDLMIAIVLPESVNMDDLHMFLREEGNGSIEEYTNALVYTNDLLPAKEDSYMTFLFPSSLLSEMDITENESMLAQTLEEENDWQNRATHLTERFSTLKIILMMLVVFIIFITSYNIYIHPIRKREDYDEATLIQLFENTDLFFIEYIESLFLQLNDKAVISALFSLKTRGIIRIEKVSSNKGKTESTMRFTWIDYSKEIDEADQYLQDWLFTEGSDGVKRFALEEIIDDETEAAKKRKKKGKEFESHIKEWKKLVLKRDSYQHVRHPYQLYKWISMLFVLISSSVFYYFITIDLLNPTEQLGLKIMIGLSTLIAIIFSRNKFVLFFYYVLIATLSILYFSMYSAGVWVVVFYFITLIASLSIPAYYWTDEVAPIKHAINKASELMREQKYPVGTDTTIIENRLLLAIVLNQGKKYAKQINQEEIMQKLKVNSVMLANTDFVLDSIRDMSIYSSSGDGGSSSSGGSSSGGGGAGAF